MLTGFVSNRQRKNRNCLTKNVDSRRQILYNGFKVEQATEKKEKAK